MRKIKFRAWDKSDKIMYYNVQTGIVFDDESHYDFRRFIGHQERDDYHEWELMQYTGLKDKLGNEIYEADVLETKEGCCGVVTYNEGQYVLSTQYGSYNNDLFYLVKNHGGIVEGNVHENPELLEKP